ncbi:MAG: winged helix-turn-helix transcriptional regulator [Lachnospiraceae bacterium]|nr:winged helix-turn-helix transcriptional regulator [Lachnospiraceae bacterium]
MAEFVLPHEHGEEKSIEKLKNNLSNENSFETVADIFQQLSDPTRIRIFWLLCHYEECVINISAILEMSSPAVSHHLRPLKNSGLIVSRREGKEVYYRAADTEEARLLHGMIEEVMKIKCPNI